MPLRIADIVNLPELRSRLLSGSQGGERLVHWAHVCELPNPAEWLGEGDLLMTTGMGVPKDPSEQCKYIEVLAHAGLAGIMIGENMQAPANLEALQNTAERLGFPVLLTERGVPFSSVTRTIIDANRKEEFERRNAINRLCVSARMAIEGLSLESLLQRLEKDTYAKLVLLDLQTLRPWLPKQAQISNELQDAMRGQLNEFTDADPVVRRYGLADGEAYAISVPSSIGCVLLARSKEHHLLDYSLLHHLVAVLGIALERLHVETERTLRIGSELVDDLLNHRLSPYQARKKLEQFDMHMESAHLVVAHPPKHKLAEWVTQFQRAGLSVLLRPQGEELILIVQADTVSPVQAIVNAAFGLSNVIEHSERLPEALREGRLALVHATTDQAVMAYSQIADKVPWLPKSLDEAAHTFRRVLGPLADYEQENGTPLLQSLRVFLEQNRSWQNAAKQLHIHKTTLIYRMRRIESMTGRSLDRTEDVAILWLALQAAEIAGMYAPRKAKWESLGDLILKNKET